MGWHVVGALAAATLVQIFFRYLRYWKVVARRAPFGEVTVVGLALLAIVVSTLIRKEHISALGLHFRLDKLVVIGVFCPLCLLLVFVFPCILLPFLKAHAKTSSSSRQLTISSTGWLSACVELRSRWLPLRFLFLYMLWGTLQHLFYNGFLLRMLILDTNLPSSLCVFVAALLFAAVHHPDRLLMRLCFPLFLWLGGVFAISTQTLKRSQGGLAATESLAVPVSVIWIGMAHGLLGFSAGLRPALGVK
eukprot:gb/GEZN01010645.1/.p1 GENE.gb/GEZN01010645.1/~~gb/GEZN01010645.1/.p1  ORF type:complete len:248 (+),score=23.55 gb/GEZN01010645.1/:74-817(+)